MAKNNCTNQRSWLQRTETTSVKSKRTRGAHRNDETEETDLGNKLEPKTRKPEVQQKACWRETQLRKPLRRVLAPPPLRAPEPPLHAAAAATWMNS